MVETFASVGTSDQAWTEKVCAMAAARDLEWYETLAMLKSTAILTRIGYLRRDAGEPLIVPIDENPLLDLLARRIA